MSRSTTAGAIAGEHRWQATSTNERDSVFRKARLHSRMVRFLRIGIPVVALLYVAGIVISIWFNPLRVLAQLPSNARIVVAGTKITMEVPKVSGFTSDQRAYNLIARTAAQDITKPDLIELKGIDGKVEMADKSLINVNAVAGLYNSKSEILNLSKDIVLTSSTGYKGYLSEATVDIKKGNVVSEMPVKVTLNESVIDSKRLEITNGGDLMRFDGGVVMVVKLPPAPNDKPSAETQAE